MTVNKPEIVLPLDEEYQLLPFEYGPLDEIHLKKAEIELNEDPKTKQEAIELLKEKVKSEPTTSELNLDDEYILRFLRAHKFDISYAFNTICHGALFLKKYKELYEASLFENLEYTVDHGILSFLPWRCNDGCAVLWVQLDKWDPKKIPVDDIKRMATLFFLEALKEPLTQINGFKVIWDVQSNPLKHIRYCTPENLWMLYHGSQVCIPGRYKEIHFVNQSLTFRAAWLVIKQLLSPELRSRMHFHSDPSTLKNFFPEAILPKIYGGQQGPCDHKEWFRKATKKDNLDMLFGRLTSSDN